MDKKSPLSKNLKHKVSKNYFSQKIFLPLLERLRDAINRSENNDQVQLRLIIGVALAAGATALIAVLYVVIGHKLRVNKDAAAAGVNPPLQIQQIPQQIPRA